MVERMYEAERLTRSDLDDLQDAADSATYVIRNVECIVEYDLDLIKGELEDLGNRALCGEDRRLLYETHGAVCNLTSEVRSISSDLHVLKVSMVDTHRSLAEVIGGIRILMNRLEQLAD